MLNPTVGIELRRILELADAILRIYGRKAETQRKTRPYAPLYGRGLTYSRVNSPPCKQSLLLATVASMVEGVTGLPPAPAAMMSCQHSANRPRLLPSPSPLLHGVSMRFICWTVARVRHSRPNDAGVGETAASELCSCVPTHQKVRRSQSYIFRNSPAMLRSRNSYRLGEIEVELPRWYVSGRRCDVTRRNMPDREDDDDATSVLDDGAEGRCINERILRLPGRAAVGSKERQQGYAALDAKWIVGETVGWDG